jgi:hypothetical protein
VDIGCHPLGAGMKAACKEVRKWGSHCARPGDQWTEAILLMRDAFFTKIIPSLRFSRQTPQYADEIPHKTLSRESETSLFHDQIVCCMGNRHPNIFGHSSPSVSSTFWISGYLDSHIPNSVVPIIVRRPPRFLVTGFPGAKADLCANWHS